MCMQNVDNFLDEYTKTETLLRRNEKLPDTILDYENSLDQETMEKLRLCRQIRNYCRHHDDYKKFITAVSDGMLDFLKEVQSEISKGFMTAGDKTRRLSGLTLADTIQDAIIAVSESPIGAVPVLDEKRNVLGVVNEKVIVALMAAGSRKTSKLSSVYQSAIWEKSQKYKVVSSDTILEDIDASDNVPVFVVSKGKYKGFLTF